MTKRLLPLLLLLVATSFAEARDREPFVPQHELRLTAGVWPLIAYVNMWTTCVDEYFVPGQPRRGSVYTSGAWSLAYDYRFARWFDLGLALSYYGEYNRLYGSFGWTPIGHDRTHCVSVMPVVRLTWLDRKWVRMYSSAGMGVLVERETYGSGGSYRDVLVAFQFTPIGISVGRALFGFAEIGFGAQGTAMIGVGYKFGTRK